jgi:vancomycin permeability regulator SanA
MLYVATFLSYALRPRRASADLAVVPGSAVLPDGTPSARLTARLNAAVDAYRAHLVPLIMVSGGRGAAGFDEAAVMRDSLLRAGIPDAAILADPDGGNTRATAEHAIELMHNRHLKRVMVGTQYFHIPRCILALHQAGADDISSAYPRFFEARDLYAIVRELVALPIYLIRPRR